MIFLVNEQSRILMDIVFVLFLSHLLHRGKTIVVRRRHMYGMARGELSTKQVLWRNRFGP